MPASRPVTLATLALIGGCGGSGGGVDGASDGTRLHLAWYEIDELRTWDPGAPLRDVMRDEECAPHTWLDGATRCTPGGFDDVVYRDASCTQLAARAPGPYATEEVHDCGTSRTKRLFQVATTSTTSAYWVMAGDTCVPGGDGALYDLGQEVPADQLVAIVSTTSTVGDFRIRSLSSDDGMQLPVAFRDRALDADCAFGDRANATTVRCRPAESLPAADARFYAGTCDGPPLIPVQAGCASPPVAFEPATCAYLLLGDPATPDHVSDNGTCTAAPALPDTTYYPLGAAISTGTLTRAPDETVGERILPIYVTGDGGRLWDGLYDRMLDTDCTIRPVADGTERCLPATPNLVRTLFLDAACQQPIELAVIAPPATCFSSTPTSYAIRATPSTDPTAADVFTYGAPYTGPAFELDATGCIPWATGTLHTLEVPIPTSSFVVAIRGTD